MLVVGGAFPVTVHPGRFETVFQDFVAECGCGIKALDKSVVYDRKGGRIFCKVSVCGIKSPVGAKAFPVAGDAEICDNLIAGAVEFLAFCKIEGCNFTGGSFKNKSSAGTDAVAHIFKIKHIFFDCVAVAEGCVKVYSAGKGGRAAPLTHISFYKINFYAFIAG